MGNVLTMIVLIKLPKRIICYAGRLLSQLGLLKKPSGSLKYFYSFILQNTFIKISGEGIITTSNKDFETERSN